MTAQLSTIITEAANALDFKVGVSAAIKANGYRVDSYTIANGTGAKYQIWALADTDEALMITSSKTGKDFRSNDIGKDGKLQRNYGTAKHHAAMDAIAIRINEVGVTETIRTLSGGVSCACCGSPLTDDLSRSRGIGPVCWQRLLGKGPAWVRYIAKVNAQELVAA